MTEQQLLEHAYNASAELGAAVGLIKFAHEHPQYQDRLFVRLSPEHRLLLDCFQQAGGQLAGQIRRAA